MRDEDIMYPRRLISVADETVMRRTGGYEESSDSILNPFGRTFDSSEAIVWKI